MDIKRIKKKYYGQLYAHKFDNIEEMSQFLKDTMCQNIHKKQTVWIGLYILKKFKDSKLIINNLPKQKAPGPNEFTG